MKLFEIVFTILVIIVIGILSIFPYLREIRAKPKSAMAIPKMEPIRTAISRYRSNTGMLPSSLEDLVSCPVGLEFSWKGPYLTESQLLDPWGNKYRLDYGYRLQSLGADGINGGTGENADVERFTGLVKN
jgi:hypothetical protein